jgi:hypothetical protein
MEAINYQAKVIELTKQLEKQKKSRTDKGKKRMKYDSSLPDHYKEYLKRANRKGFAFELTVEEFNRMKELNCEYCGEQANGIDRISSSEGYVHGNMVPCCSMCNMMKLNHSVEKFLKKVSTIYEHQEKKGFHSLLLTDN